MSQTSSVTPIVMPVTLPSLPMSITVVGGGHSHHSNVNKPPVYPLPNPTFATPLSVSQPPSQHPNAYYTQPTQHIIPASRAVTTPAPQTMVSTPAHTPISHFAVAVLPRNDRNRPVTSHSNATNNASAMLPPPPPPPQPSTQYASYYSYPQPSSQPYSGYAPPSHSHSHSHPPTSTAVTVQQSTQLQSGHSIPHFGAYPNYPHPIHPPPPPPSSSSTLPPPPPPSSSSTATVTADGSATAYGSTQYYQPSGYPPPPPPPPYPPTSYYPPPTDSSVYYGGTAPPPPPPTYAYPPQHSPYYFTHPNTAFVYPPPHPSSIAAMHPPSQHPPPPHTMTASPQPSLHSGSVYATIATSANSATAISTMPPPHTLCGIL